MGRPKKYVNMRIKISEIGSLAKANPVFSKLAKRYVTAKVTEKEPELSRKCVTAIREALKERREAYIRVPDHSNKARVVSPSFYKVSLKYPMNDPKVVQKAIAARKRA